MSNENLIVRHDYTLEEGGMELFTIHRPGKEKAGLTFGLGKARLLYEALWDDPEAFIDQLTAYVKGRESVIEAESRPVKTLEYAGATFGLFADGSIKQQAKGPKKAYWRNVASKYEGLITPEAFDHPESLQQVIVQPARSRAKDEELETLKANMAQMQAMMAQMLAMQTAKV